MSNIYFAIALISAGASLVTGLISVMIGFRSEGETVNWVFGIMTIFFFVFILFPPAGYVINDTSPYPLTLEVKRLFIWSYYIMMPYFFEAYTGLRKKYVTAIITITAAATYVLMVFTGAGVVLPAWRVLVYLPLGLILIYGFVLGRLQYRTGSKEDARWLLAAMTLFAVSYGMSLFEVFGRNYFVRFFGAESFFPFHINTLAFILIMALRIRASAFKRYRLEQILRLNNERWEQLLHNIQTIVIKLDKQGDVT